MVFEGKIYKHEKWWIIEVPVLDLMTQGKTKREARFMLKDAIHLLVEDKKLKLKFITLSKHSFLLQSNNPTLLLSLFLKRQRASQNLSLSAMAKKLKVKSKNAYAQYEQGRSEPSLSKLQEFISALLPNQEIAIRLIGVR